MIQKRNWRKIPSVSVFTLITRVSFERAEVRVFEQDQSSNDEPIAVAAG